ncbi:hypothetical protein [Paracoccus mutanolyticus]|uniref:hypothetical protein n=1 Tax=Paracoccus mutanolyticus TaxID=1499308 RepID=UPI00167930AC|nr:hypothetical protein [Paracoccus mutanolyticus]
MNDDVVEVLFGTFALLMVLGAPIVVALGVAALAAMLYLGATRSDGAVSGRPCGRSR